MAQKIFDEFIADELDDKARREAVVRRSGPDYTIVQPSVLTDEEPTGSYRFGEALEFPAHGLPPWGGSSSDPYEHIARADVAHFIIGEVDRKNFRHAVVELSY